MLTVNEALKCLLEMAAQVPESEMLAISKANGRVLAESQYSGIDVPNADNAAMDGYAIRFSDLNGTGTVLTVRQRVPAGHIGGKLQNGEAARIFTGAPIPEGADTVVRQEWCEVDG
jgi:molybdopterin molybdotransferase